MPPPRKPQYGSKPGTWLKAGLYSTLLALQGAVVYRYRHIFFGGAAVQECGWGRYCELSKWSLGQPLPIYMPTRPTVEFKTEWPPEHGPEFVPTTPGLTHLIMHDNDPPKRAAWGGRWRTPVVVVPSVYNEYDRTIPGWVVSSLWSRFRSLFIYQRRDPAGPRYAPNFGTESGVYYRFIVEHYDDLPDLTVFVHMYPEAHNIAWLEWVHALRPNATFSSLSDYFVDLRRYDEMMEGSPYSLWAEQCLRDIFEDVGQPLPPREPLIANGFCCAEVVASRDQIRKRSKAAYAKILERIGSPPGLCHLGAPPRNDTYFSRTDPSQFVGDELDDGFTGYGKQVLGHATEYSLSSVIGGVALNEPMTDWDGYCQHFFHHCAFPGSPCKGPNRRPKDVCPNQYYSDDELEPEVVIAWDAEVEPPPEEEEEGHDAGSAEGDEGAGNPEADGVRRLRAQSVERPDSGTPRFNVPSMLRVPKKD